MTGPHGRRPIRRALISVYDKTGLAAAGARSARRGRRHRLHRIHSENDCRGRHSGHARRAGHRIPGDARRPREDPAPDGACRAARRHPQARTRRRARRARHRAIRPRRRQPVPVHRDGPIGSRRRRVRRTDRHRRSRDGAGRGEEPPERRGSHRPAWATTACWPPCAPAGSPPTSGRSWRRWRFGTPPNTTSRSRPGWALCWRPRMTTLRRPYRPGSPASGAGRRCCGTARTRISRRRSTATMPSWPGLAQAEQLHGKEMSVQQLHRRRRRLASRVRPRADCVAIIKHANPCGIAISSISVADAHRKAHECDPLSAFGGVIAANTAVSVEMAETVADIFTEVIIAPAYEDGALDVLTRKKNIRVLVASEPLRAAPSSPGERRSAAAASATRSTRPATTRSTGRWPPARPPIPDTLADLKFAWRTLPRGEVQRDRDRQRRRHGGRRHGPGEPRRRGAAGRRARAGTGCAARSRRPTRSSRSPTGCETLTDAGVKAIVHPGGSMRDDVVTEAAATAGVTLYLTGARHFAH